jgi:hypothetical protein
MGLDFLRGFSDSSIAAAPTGMESAKEIAVQRRLLALAARPGIRRVALLAVCLLLAACKQGGGGGY